MPDLSRALDGLTPAQRDQVSAQLELVEQDRMPEDAFWRVWCALTGRTPPEAGPGTWHGDLDPATLPTWLAHPWYALCTEDHPRERLHRLVDTAELLVRWTVALALAEVVLACEGELPAKATRSIGEHIQRPTLGRWLNILRALDDAAPAEPRFTDGLFARTVVHLLRQFEPEGRGGTVENSLLALRNKVAHGGCLSLRKAEALVAAHLPTLIEMLVNARETLGATQVVADGLIFMGTRPAEPAPPGLLPAGAEGAWLVRGERALALAPLAWHGPVAQLGADGQLHVKPDESAPQLYTRCSPDHLDYTPLGCDEVYARRRDVTHFRALFRLDEPRRAPGRPLRGDGFAWDDFSREARLVSEDLVGRQDELSTIKTWLKSVRPHDPKAVRMGWLEGGPGVGKSLLMARLAASYHNPKHRGLFVHRFRGGDARNSRRSFLQLLQAALCAWEPLANLTSPHEPETLEGQALEDDVKARLQAVANIVPPQPEASPPAFWVMLDGLDEVAVSDPDLPTLLKSLALPGTLWLMAGRPDYGLSAAFRHPSCAVLFEGGLPPMRAGDIRAMLLDGLEMKRYALLARDEDTDQGVQNTFVDAVVERAGGLPLYVHLLLEDLRAGHLGVDDEDRLPRGLTAYYDELVDRLGVSDVKSDLTAIVALLSQTTEPIDVPGLALLLQDHTDRVDRYLPRVEAAIRVGAALLRQAPSPDTDQGWSLYHQSFREYVNQTSALAGSVQDRRERLTSAAGEWAQLDEPRFDAVRKHLFRWGTEYTLQWQGDTGPSTARGRLTNFAYLQARTAALPAHECTDLAEDYKAVLAALGSEDRELALWEAFFRERIHLLRHGSEDWPANRILLQLAAEHADDSPVTLAADAWMASGGCDWLWLRRTRRAERVAPSACLMVLEGHTGHVLGAMSLPDGRLLSWSRDNTLRLWNGATGELLATLEGHWGPVKGATMLPDGRLLSWSDDDSLRLWNGATGEHLGRIKSPLICIDDAVALPGGRLLSWYRNRFHLWDGATEVPPGTFEWHTSSLIDAKVLSDGRLLTRSKGQAPRLWNGTTGEHLATLEGHTGGVRGATVLPDGRLLSWSTDNVLHLWNGVTGELLATLEGHTSEVLGATMLPDGRLLSWSTDGTFRLWDGTTGEPLTAQEWGLGQIIGATAVVGGRVLSWSWLDRRLHLRDGTTGELLAPLEGHTGPVVGATSLPDGRLLSWSWDNTLRLWSSAVGGRTPPTDGFSIRVFGSRFLPDGQLLSWGDDTLRISDGGTGENLAVLKGHTGWVTGATVLPDGRLLSWSTDNTLRLWDGATGEPLMILEGHTDDVKGATQLPDGRLLSWSLDKTLRLWDGGTGELLATLEGHTKAVGGGTMLPDGRLLSWSGAFLRLWDGSTGLPLLELAGHMAWVLGATMLPDGRLLSWSGDHTLCLWDGVTGEPLASLEGHLNVVDGATVLPDGRLLSWSRDDTLRLWDGATGRALDMWTKESAVREVPELYGAYRAAQRSGSSTISAWAEGRQGSVRLMVEGLRERGRVEWHANGEWEDDHLIQEGSLAAHCGHDLALVHLYHGAQRVTLDEARARMDDATAWSSTR